MGNGGLGSDFETENFVICIEHNTLITGTISNQAFPRLQLFSERG